MMNLVALAAAWVFYRWLEEILDDGYGKQTHGPPVSRL
tara:strand:- start:592 stop:705 length:114 start_codon:yes stop_codon:yes gene_type:complete